MLAEQVDHSAVDTIDFDRVRDKISIFGGLSDRQVKLLLPYLKEICVQEGDTIFKQGQLPCNVYIVMSGEIALDVKRDDGSYARVRYVAGDCFGESAVIGIQPQLGHALATTETRLLVLGRSCLLDMVNIDQELFGILMMNIAREVSRRLHVAVAAPAGQKEYPVMRA